MKRQLIIAIGLGVLNAHCTRVVSTVPAGYTPLQPPSRLIEPGAMVVTWKDPANHPPRIVCDAHSSIGVPDAPDATGYVPNAVITSPTTEEVRQRISEARARLEAEANAAVAKAGAADKVTTRVVVTDTRVRVLPGNAIEFIKSNKKRFASCVDSMRTARKKDLSPRMVTQVYQATIDVNLDFNSSLTAEAKLALLDAVKLELGVSSSGSDSIKGQDLVYGYIEEDVGDWL